MLWFSAMKIETSDYRVEVAYDVNKYGPSMDELIKEIAHKYRGVIGGAYTDFKTREVGVYFLTRKAAIDGYRGLKSWADKCGGIEVSPDLIEYDEDGEVVYIDPELEE